MSLRTRRIFYVTQATVAALAAVASPGSAQAANPNCSSLPGTIIYGAGGSAQQPLLAQIGTQLAASASPVSIVYSDSGSACAGYNDLVTPTGITGTALYWDGSGNTLTCQLDPGGDPVTFAVMGNAPNLCGGVTGLASGFGQFLGPVQPIDFVVPSSSNEQSISTEAAYYIWGFGASDANHTVSPWATVADIFTRSASSFVGLFVSLDTGVPAATVAAHGTSESTNSATVAALSALNGTAGAGAGIGFVSGEVADGNRSAIKVLAYQHTGQTCGYWPDSTIDAFDKVNVRSGQYWLWSPVHFYAAINSSNQIADASTAAFIGLFTGAVTAPSGVDVFAAEVGAYTVPSCAMQAWRDGDLAAPYSFEPAAPCSCKFDFAENNANKPATCTTCTQNSDCTTNHCRNIGPPLGADAGADAGAAIGYCEVN
jgi:hypothetical protein